MTDITLEDKNNDTTTASPLKNKKHVSFGDCEIREYQIIIGDHPMCKKGLPLSLGWKYSKSQKISIYEQEMNQRPYRELRMSAKERRYVLHEVSGYSLSYLECMEDLRAMIRLRNQDDNDNDLMKSNKQLEEFLEKVF
eukprot:CAMPEP_0118694774 /NCGR_PEP_ID=MMETSP0800-20121206/12756_1 /TAXON_ID=210618 ORGANISM="Striatella unipunctata, Strain CCMP2910" /NCGR_SAMPLE_ID=MMETSP0800 /ASSEMBLY_ACC=CAM_ASM_000638 /LENGTH=137 /DNA_ID=CAMNT_0006593369 /DNA_START=111 /DNA_END=524 /DNA_ORIENTATION=+